MSRRASASSEPAAAPRPPGPLRLSVILPAYNEAGTIGTVIEQVLGVDLGPVELELVIIESNSDDGTREIVKHHADDPRVEVVLQREARGKGNAVRAGLALATGDIVLIQDGDLEYRVEDYPALLQPILDGRADFVLGSRHVRGRPMREFAENRATSRLLNAAHWGFTGMFDAVYGVRLRDPFTMYKVFRRSCLDGVTLESDRFDFDWELVAKLIRLGYPPVEVPVSYHSRDFQSGKKVRLWRDPITWMRALVRFRVMPVRSFYAAPVAAPSPVAVGAPAPVPTDVPSPDQAPAAAG